MLLLGTCQRHRRDHLHKAKATQQETHKTVHGIHQIHRDLASSFNTFRIKNMDFIPTNITNSFKFVEFDGFVSMFLKCVEQTLLHDLLRICAIEHARCCILFAQSRIQSQSVHFFHRICARSNCPAHFSRCSFYCRY